MNDFIKEGLKVGDTLYTLFYGYAEVVEINTSPDRLYQIKLKSGCCTNIWITRDGKMTSTHVEQSVFWSKPEIVAPPRPKRKVIKTIEGFVNIYNQGKPKLDYAILYKKQGLALKYIANNNIVAAARATLTYEVEE